MVRALTSRFAEVLDTQVGCGEVVGADMVQQLISWRDNHTKGVFLRCVLTF